MPESAWVSEEYLDVDQQGGEQQCGLHVAGQASRVAERGHAWSRRSTHDGAVGRVGQRPVVELDGGHVFEVVAQPGQAVSAVVCGDDPAVSGEYCPFISGQVLKTLPASRPATMEPAAMVSASRWMVSMAHFLVFSMFGMLMARQEASAEGRTSVRPFHSSSEKMPMAQLRCTKSL